MFMHAVQFSALQPSPTMYGHEIWVCNSRRERTAETTGHAVQTFEGALGVQEWAEAAPWPTALFQFDVCPYTSRKMI
jgi:hypothetical protein